MTRSAGKEISKEEGNNRLASSSFYVGYDDCGLVSVSDVINFRLETVIITSWASCSEVVVHANADCSFVGFLCA